MKGWFCSNRTNLKTAFVATEQTVRVKEQTVQQQNYLNGLKLVNHTNVKQNERWKQSNWQACTYQVGIRNNVLQYQLFSRILKKKITKAESAKHCEITVFNFLQWRSQKLKWWLKFLIKN